MIQKQQRKYGTKMPNKNALVKMENTQTKCLIKMLNKNAL